MLIAQMQMRGRFPRNRCRSRGIQDRDEIRLDAPSLELSDNSPNNSLLLTLRTELKHCAAWRMTN